MKYAAMQWLFCDINCQLLNSGKTLLFNGVQKFDENCGKEITDKCLKRKGGAEVPGCEGFCIPQRQIFPF